MERYSNVNVKVKNVQRVRNVKYKYYKEYIRHKIMKMKIKPRVLKRTVKN